MQTQTTCPDCGWTWWTYFKDGKKLENWWLEDVKEILEVKIPAGIKDDVYLKYSWKWDEWPNWTPNGNLFIQINIEPHPYFKRDWDDIYMDQEVSIYDLVLGGEYEINHPTWKIKFKIPKWTQLTENIKINWKWFGSGWILSKKWDLYIVPKLRIPKKLSKEQEKLWNQLKNSD